MYYQQGVLLHSQRICTWRTCASFGILLSLAAAGSANAQTDTGEKSKQNEEDATMEEVFVTGFRQSTEKNLEIKKMSSSIMEAITAEDVGKFPDKNVADALQRVPGVTIDRSGGEGGTVSIRGTSSDWTMTLLNGNYIATSGSGGPSRSFNYTMLPSTMIGRAEIYKSAEARIDEGGVGGTVILHTRKPLEMRAGEGVIAAEYTYSDTTEEYEPQFSAIYSWKNEAENFGVLLGYTQQDRTVHTINNSVSHWRYHSAAGNAAGESDVQPAIVDQATGEVYDNVWAPRSMSINVVDTAREREGVQLVLQWKPIENLELGMNYFAADLGYDLRQDSLIFAEWNDSHNAYFGIELDGDTVISLGQGDNGLLNDNNLGDADKHDGEPVMRGLMSPQVLAYERLGSSKSETFDFDVIYQADNYRLSFDFGRTEAKGGTSRWTYGNADAREGSVNDWRWYLEDGKPHYESSTDFSSDREAFPYYDWFNSGYDKNLDREDYFQTDFALDTQWGTIEVARVGLKWRDHLVQGRPGGYYWDDGIADNGGYRGWLPGDQWFHNVDFHPDPLQYMGETPIDNSAGNLGAIDFLPIDFNQLYDYVESNFTETVVPRLAGTYDIGEEIYAMYLQFDYRWNRLHGNFGGRYVETHQYALTNDAIEGQNDSGERVQNQRDTTNSNFLPSVNAIYDFSDDLLLRFSAAKTMTRVAYSDLGTAESYGAPLHEGGDEAYGSAGNAELEALSANQYDLALEWYYAQGSAIGATLFRKDISNFVVSGEEVVQRQHICCGTINVRMRRPVNGGEATSEGLELFIQHTFESGFGAMANYTYTDTSTASVDTEGVTTEAEIPGTAKDQYNLSVYYEVPKFSVRASYNWRSKRAKGIHKGFNYYSFDYGQLDLNAAYNFTDELSLTASVINATKEIEEDYWKQENRLTGNFYAGRRFYVGLNYKF